MYTLYLADVKKLDADGLRVQIDKAISAMIYPHDDPAFEWPERGQADTLQIFNDKGEMIEGNMVALRYL